MLTQTKVFDFKFINPADPIKMQEATRDGWFFTAITDAHGALFRKEIKRQQTEEEKQKTKAEFARLARAVRNVFDELNADILPVYTVSKELMLNPEYAMHNNGSSPLIPSARFLEYVSSVFVVPATDEMVKIYYHRSETKNKKFPKAKHFLKMEKIES